MEVDTANGDGSLAEPKSSQNYGADMCSYTLHKPLTPIAVDAALCPGGWYNVPERSVNHLRTVRNHTNDVYNPTDSRREPEKPMNRLS